MKKIILLIAITGFIFTGCIKKDDCCLPSVISVDRIFVPMEGGYDVEYITISCSMHWNLSDADNLPLWLDEVEPKSGNGTTMVKLAALPNDDQVRTVVLIFKAVNGDRVEVTVRQDTQYKEFMLNERPRWEEDGQETEYNDESPNTFVTDKTGKILADATDFPNGSSMYTVGRHESKKGDWFDYLAFTNPDPGRKDGWISTQDADDQGILFFQILKKEADMLWIVFRQNSDSPERRVVQ